MRKLILAIAAIGLVACEAAHEPPAATQTDASAPVISVTRSGNLEGRTVALIPGLASSAEVWDATRAVLEADYDVRTVQVAGFAGADPAEVEGDYTDAIAGAIVEELTMRPGHAPVLVGHSMGGFVSMKAGLAAPDLVDELVIVDSLPFLAGLFIPGATPEMAAAQGPVMAAQMAAMPREAFDAQQVAGLGRLVKTQSSLPMLEDWSRASGQAVVSQVMGELMAADLRADLAGLEMDALVMMPWDEAMGLPREQVQGVYQSQYAEAPGVRIQVIEDAFHFIMLDQADLFHAGLLAALAD